MTKRHYFQSLGIFICAVVFIKNVFGIFWPEAVFTVILAIVCVVHTIDVMRDIHRRKREKKNGDIT